MRRRPMKRVKCRKLSLPGCRKELQETCYLASIHPLSNDAKAAIRARSLSEAWHLQALPSYLPGTAHDLAHPRCLRRDRCRFAVALVSLRVAAEFFGCLSRHGHAQKLQTNLEGY